MNTSPLTSAFTTAVDAVNAHDAKAFAATYAADAVVHDPLYPQPLKGRDAIEQDMVELLRAFPDARVTVGPLLQDGETVAGEYTLRGTHLGPLASPEGEIPATGNSIDNSGAVFSKFNADGEVIEERRYYDAAGLLAQIEPAAAT
ncbi:ester cyclase [Pseudarthrobacter sp. NPDC055928]|uniref:ester cyclase n=1 Tax=unclassified Pseudarthrobacter TaxID=2647000 RepID=UPI003076A28B